MKHYEQQGNCLCSCDQLLHVFFATGDCVIGGHYQFVMYSFALQRSFVPASVGLSAAKSKCKVCLSAKDKCHPLSKLYSKFSDLGIRLLSSIL